MAKANDEFDDATIALDVERKGNIYLTDKMANAREDYDDASIAIDNDQIGYLYCNEKENYYSTLDYTQGKITTPGPPPRLRGVSKNVSNGLIEKMASKSKQHVRVNGNFKCDHISTIVKTQRTIIKLVITLSFAIVAITVASSAIAVILIRQDVKIEPSTLKRLKFRCSDEESSWSTWSMWKDCNATCNAGLRIRNRTCSGSDQVESRGSCKGYAVDISACYNSLCNETQLFPSVFFSANTVADTNPDVDENLVFITNLYNKGEGYDNATGVFTAPVTGDYQFTVQICISRNTQITIGLIMKDNEILNHTINGTNYEVCSSVDTLAEMKQGLRARVVVKHVIGTNIINSSKVHSNKFSGLLINI